MRGNRAGQSDIATLDLKGRNLDKEEISGHRGYPAPVTNDPAAR